MSLKKPKESNILTLTQIKPKTINQQKIFDAYDDDKHLFIHGLPGTGKTFIGSYLALDSILNEEEYDKLIIVRSTVPSRKQGFLPGNEDDKNEVYEIPHIAVVNELFRKPDAYKMLKMRDKVKFLSTSYLRGMTLDNCVILIDEVQNMTFMEIHTIITRAGENCRIIICGDEFQNDLENQNEDSCIDKLHRIMDNMKSFKKIEMGINDICRNSLVKEWIIAQSSV